MFGPSPTLAPCSEPDVGPSPSQSNVETLYGLEAGYQKLFLYAAFLKGLTAITFLVSRLQTPVVGPLLVSVDTEAHSRHPMAAAVWVVSCLQYKLLVVPNRFLIHNLCGYMLSEDSSI